MTTRRGLFGLFAGALATPLLAKLPAPMDAVLLDQDFVTHAQYVRYSGYEVLNVSRSDILAAAEYNWKQNAVSVRMVA